MAVGEILSLGTSNGGIWHLNGNSSDSGPNGNNGTDTDISYISGKFQQGASLNGTTSKISFADAASLKPTGAFTHGIWLKTAVTGTAMELFINGSAETNEAGTSAYIKSTNVIEWESAKNTGTTANTDYKVCTGTRVVTDGIAHLAIITWDTANMNLYVDGSIDASVAWPNAPAYEATSYHRIGSRKYASAVAEDQFFSGTLDEGFLINGIAWDVRQVKNYYAWATGKMTVVL